MRAMMKTIFAASMLTLFLAFVVSAKDSETTKAMAYCDEVFRYTAMRVSMVRMVADLSKGKGKEDWKELKRQSALKNPKNWETYQKRAMVWLKNERIVSVERVDQTLLNSEKQVSYSYYETGNLARVIWQDLRQSPAKQGKGLVTFIQYFDGKGAVLHNVAGYYDPKTKKHMKWQGKIGSAPTVNYRRTNELPFYGLFQKKP